LKLNNEFTRYVTYNQEGKNSCKDSGCLDEGICRCYKITSISVNKVDVISIMNDIYSQINDNDKSSKRDNKLAQLIYNYDKEEVDKYSINRVLTKYKIYDKYNWDISHYNGYYGDEIDKASIEGKIFNEVKNKIKEVISIDPLDEKIKYLLKMEYGHILDKVKDGEYMILSVDKNDIEFGQKEHLKKTLKEDSSFYSDSNYRNLPRGIAFYENGKWKVIDGYHRISETIFPKVRIIGIKNKK